MFELHLPHEELPLPRPEWCLLKRLMLGVPREPRQLSEMREWLPADVEQWRLRRSGHLLPEWP